MPAQYTTPYSGGPVHGGPVHIYIDDSDIAIGGRHLHYPEATGRRFVWNYDTDVLYRIVAQDFKFTRTGEFMPIWLNFYGADLRRSRQLGYYRQQRVVNAVDCPRNAQGQEKQADVGLAVGVTRRVTNALDFDDRCDFFVVTGDSDLIPAVKLAAENEFHVHIWSWRASLCQEYRRLKTNSLMDDLSGFACSIHT